MMHSLNPFDLKPAFPILAPLVPIPPGLMILLTGKHKLSDLR